MNRSSRDLWLSYFILEAEYVGKVGRRTEVTLPREAEKAKGELERKRKREHAEKERKEKEAGKSASMRMTRSRASEEEEEDEEEVGLDGSRARTKGKGLGPIRVPRLPDDGEEGAAPSADDAVQMADFLSGAVPRTVYRHAVLACPEDAVLRVSIASACSRFPFLEDMPAAILASLEKDLPRAPETWEALAEALECTPAQRGPALEALCARALAAAPQGEGFFLKMLSRGRSAGWGRKPATALMDAACASEADSEAVWLSFFELFGKVERDLARATSRHPKCPALWLIAASHAPENRRAAVLDGALAHIHSAALWIARSECEPGDAGPATILSRALVDSRPLPLPEADKVRKALLAATPAESRAAILRKLVRMPPLSPALHRLAIDSESSPAAKTALIESLVRLVGDSDPTVWVLWIKHERTIGDHKRASVLYERARRELRKEKVADFDAIINPILQGTD